MLRALSGPLAGATFEVGARVLIGRVDACDVVVADVEVSREHVMIVNDAGTPTLVDLGSCNGTLVDGKRIKRVALEPGDTFMISTSRFLFDRAAPISTTPVLASQLGVQAQQASSDAEIEGRPTRETSAAGTPPVTSEARDTRRSMMAVGDAADTVEDDVPERPPADGPSANDVEKPPAPGRATVRLEAANVEAPVDTGRATVKLQAVDTEPQPAGDLHSRATAELSAVAPAPEAEPEEPVTFAPPPTPMPTKPAEEPTAAEAKPKKKKKSKAKVDPYRGDLLADVTDYRSFRLRLQRGEIPTGDEVAAMIDLEAVLREPPAESSPHRDVVTQRFFRRFPFDASVTARFTHGGEIHEVKGKVSNLSVDGLQCVLELDGFEPKRDQHAMLIIDCTRGFLDVRYSITARVVYSRRGKVGFVFAGVPSWAERGEHQHVETAVRARPKPEA